MGHCSAYRHSLLGLALTSYTNKQAQRRKCVGCHVLAPGGRGCIKNPVRDSEGLSRSGGARGAKEGPEALIDAVTAKEEERAYVVVVCFFI
jgi:hypothetical protein